MLFGLCVALGVFLADQLSKLYVMHDLLANRGVLIVSDYFNFVRAWNTGVSFSMFNNWGIWGVICLSLLALGIVGYLLWWLSHEKNSFVQFSLGCIIGGALGNVFDRVRLGAVFDFLDVHVGEYHWPAFNLADSFICIGAFLIIAQSIWQKTKNNSQNFAEKIHENR